MKLKYRMYVGNNLIRTDFGNILNRIGGLQYEGNILNRTRGFPLHPGNNSIRTVDLVLGYWYMCGLIISLGDTGIYSTIYSNKLKITSYIR